MTQSWDKLLQGEPVSDLAHHLRDEGDVQMKIYDEALYCQECNTEISVAEAKFNGNLCDECSFSTDELSPEDIKAIDKALAQRSMGPFSTDQLAMLVGCYEFKNCACGMTVCAACGACHNIRCEAKDVPHNLMSIECAEMVDFLGTYHIPTKLLSSDCRTEACKAV